MKNMRKIIIAVLAIAAVSTTALLPAMAEDAVTPNTSASVQVLGRMGQQPGNGQRGNGQQQMPGNGQRGNNQQQMPDQRQMPGNDQRGNNQQQMPGNDQRGNNQQQMPGSGQRGNNQQQMPGSGQRGNNQQQMPGNGQQQMPDQRGGRNGFKGRMPGCPNGQCGPQAGDVNGQIPDNSTEAPDDNAADSAEVPAQPPVAPMDGQAPAGMVDFDALVTDGTITQETRDAIDEYMRENAPKAPADGQDAPEASLLDDLRAANIITQAEYDAITAAQADEAPVAEAAESPVEEAVKALEEAVGATAQPDAVAEPAE